VSRTTPPPQLKYLAHYPPQLIQQIQTLLTEGRLADYLLNKYPQAHDLNSARALYDFAMAIKSEYLRSSKPVSKVIYDDKIHIINHALGLHTNIARVQGNKLKAKSEIRIAALFRRVPLEFLRMIVVHELAHLRERDHDKAFYKLCEYMEPAYHQLEFDLRVYLTHIDHAGELYQGNPTASR
jgi:predicted metal-dependent hydrolase